MIQRLYWRHTVLIAFSIGLLLYLYLGPVRTQDPLYHLFADSRGALGIPNFGDVLSNFPFLLFGFLGVHALLNTNKTIKSKTAWLTFFVGVILVAPGSAYYHWAPDNARLVWDRLPMTIGFMGMFVALVSEYIDYRLEKMLVPFILLGLSSVVLWSTTGDLRLYIWVQAASIFLIPIVALLYPKRYTGGEYLVLGFAAYALAKVVEYYDPQIFSATNGFVSGHTLKHLSASLSPFFIMKMLKTRNQLN
ncbi:MAG: hypothetical protein ACOYL6_06475 [Bacteriovoracaceae bacterium]